MIRAFKQQRFSQELIIDAVVPSRLNHGQVIAVVRSLVHKAGEHGTANLLTQQRSAIASHFQIAIIPRFRVIEWTLIPAFIPCSDVDDAGLRMACQKRHHFFEIFSCRHYPETVHKLSALLCLLKEGLRDGLSDT